MKKHFIFLAIFCYLTRLFFKWLSGFNNFELFTDSYRYDSLSTNITQGNYDLDLVAYIAAPLYPYTLAFFKYIGLGHWQSLAMHFQFFLVSISCIYIFRISFTLFKSTRLAFLSSIAYILYPLTMWYNFTFVQETSFQCYFIIFSFYFISYYHSQKTIDLFKASVFFTLSVLTKSHIIILIPFILYAFWRINKYKPIITFLLILFITNLPFAYTNWHQHKVLSLSAHGSSALMLIGHHDSTYPCLSMKASSQNKIHNNGCDLDLVFDPEYTFDNGVQINKLPYKQRNEARLVMALNWIKENPLKFIELKTIGLFRALTPGLDFRFYKLKIVLFSFIMGAIFYIPAFIYILKSRKKLKLPEYYLISLVLLVLFIFILFYPQSRFRIITLEPFLLIYGCHQIYKWITYRLS